MYIIVRDIDIHIIMTTLKYLTFFVGSLLTSIGEALEGLHNNDTGHPKILEIMRRISNHSSSTNQLNNDTNNSNSDTNNSNSDTNNSNKVSEGS